MILLSISLKELQELSTDVTLKSNFFWFGIFSFQSNRKRGIDPETIDYIIFAHNFGDVKSGTTQSDMASLATRVKNKLQIKP
jgi:hypothetical protein